MPVTTLVKLHERGPALWPDHKSEAEVMALKDLTIPSVWLATYQCTPTDPAGSIYLRDWWTGKNRFDVNDKPLRNRVVARWLSWDTANKDGDDSNYTAMTVGELTADYRLLIPYVYRERLTFPDLPDAILWQARQWNHDEKLRTVIVEDKSSGISALQTLRKTAPQWLRERLFAFQPHGDKVTRANQAAVWCKNDCVLLPNPTDDVPWLIDFEDELFDFPGTKHDDQVDSFGQLVIYTENLLSDGYKARQKL